MDLDRALWNSPQKRAAVWLVDDPAVEHDDRAGIRLAADEAADALAKFEDSLGERIAFEGPPALGLDRFEAGLGERVVGSGKRKPSDDDVRERFSRDVHTGPEAGDAEEHAVRVFAKLFHHPLGRHAGPLHEQRPALLFKMGFHGFGDRSHRLVACEKDERAGFAPVDKVGDPFFQGFFVAGILGFGHLADEVKRHLALVIERASDLQRLHLLRAYSAAEVLEVWGPR